MWPWERRVINACQLLGSNCFLLRKDFLSHDVPALSDIILCFVDIVRVIIRLNWPSLRNQSAINPNTSSYKQLPVHLFFSNGSKGMFLLDPQNLPQWSAQNKFTACMIQVIKRRKSEAHLLCLTLVFHRASDIFDTS